MTLFNQEKFSKNAKPTDYNFSRAIELDSTSHKLDGLAKGKEAIRCERLGLLEDKFVQSIFKEQRA